MPCNHFLVEDRYGLVTGWSHPGAVCAECAECGMMTNVPDEIEAAKTRDRYVGEDHPDCPALLDEARVAAGSTVVRWRTGGSCQPIAVLDDSGKVPTEFMPAPSAWQRFKAWFKNLTGWEIRL